MLGEAETAFSAFSSAFCPAAKIRGALFSNTKLQSPNSSVFFNSPKLELAVVTWISSVWFPNWSCSCTYKEPLKFFSSSAVISAINLVDTALPTSPLFATFAGMVVTTWSLVSLLGSLKIKDCTFLSEKPLALLYSSTPSVAYTVIFSSLLKKRPKDNLFRNFANGPLLLWLNSTG